MRFPDTGIDVTDINFGTARDDAFTMYRNEDGSVVTIDYNLTRAINRSFDESKETIQTVGTAASDDLPVYVMTLFPPLRRTSEPKTADQKFVAPASVAADASHRPVEARGDCFSGGQTRPSTCSPSVTGGTERFWSRGPSGV
jgi:hypothetical protein